MLALRKVCQFLPPRNLQASQRTQEIHSGEAPQRIKNSMFCTNSDPCWFIRNICSENREYVKNIEKADIKAAKRNDINDTPQDLIASEVCAVVFICLNAKYFTTCDSKK